MNNIATEFVSPIDGSTLNQNGSNFIDLKGNYYPIINQIPRFVELENYSSSFGFQWNYFDKTQVDFFAQHNGKKNL